MSVALLIQHDMRMPRFIDLLSSLNCLTSAYLFAPSHKGHDLREKFY